MFPHEVARVVACVAVGELQIGERLERDHRTAPTSQQAQEPADYGYCAMRRERITMNLQLVQSNT
jgi:hypothetical protein